MQDGRKFVCTPNPGKGGSLICTPVPEVSGCHKKKTCPSGQHKPCLVSRPLTQEDVEHRSYNGTPEENYDIIVCGSGTAGSLIVYELAKEFPTAKILVLEAGKDDVQDDAVIRTDQDGPNPNKVSLNPLETDDWGQSIRTVQSLFGEGAMSIQQDQRSLTTDEFIPSQKILGMARGMTLGGTSAVNAMIWNRGTKRGTYDKWEKATGSSDFGWTAMNNCFRQIENRSQEGLYYGHPVKLWNSPPIAAPPSFNLNPAYHGTDGRIALYQGVIHAYNDDAMNAVVGNPSGFGGRTGPLPLFLDGEDPTNPTEYGAPCAISAYSQSDPNFDSFNPYPATTPGQIFSHAGAITRGGDYAATVPQKLSAILFHGAPTKKAYTARCFAAPAFVYPLTYPEGNPDVPNNVTIKTKVYVTKLIFGNPSDPLECTGVEYVENGWHVAKVARAIRRDVKPWAGTFSDVDRNLCTPEQAKLNQVVALVGGIKKAYAKTDVWVCLGTIDSAALLQRSGVGPKDVLDGLAYSPVKCILDLPGVGRNVQDSCDLPIAALNEMDLNTYLPESTGAPTSCPMAVYETIFAAADPQSPYDINGSSSIAGAPSRSYSGGSRLRLKSSPELDDFDFDFVMTEFPITYIPFSNTLWADQLALLTNTPSTKKFDSNQLSISTYDRSKIGQYDGNGNVDGIPTVAVLSEFWNAQSKGEILITSGNVFDRPNYAPNMLSNENDLEAFENHIQNNVHPIMTGMAHQRYGPRGPWSYAYAIGIKLAPGPVPSGHMPTATEIQLSPSVQASMFRSIYPSSGISQGAYDTPNGQMLNSVITIADGPLAGSQNAIATWSGNTGNPATSYVATLAFPLPGVPTIGTKYVMSVAGELPLDSVKFSGDNNRNFVRYLAAFSKTVFSDLQKQILPGNSLITYPGSTRITVKAPQHKLVVGEYIRISGVTGPVDSIAKSELNNYHVVMDVSEDGDSFDIVLFWNKTARPVYATHFPSPAENAIGFPYGTGNTNINVHTLAFNRIGFRQWFYSAYFSGWHPASSCRMGPPDNKESVVDTRFRVYNTLGLRVCDASVLPTKPDGNTQAPTYGMAKRATELVIPEYHAFL